jgi:hypothetical protein
MLSLSGNKKTKKMLGNEREEPAHPSKKAL